MTSKRQVEELAAQHDRKLAAGAEAERAAGDAMRAIVEAVRPALPALCSAIQVAGMRRARGQEERMYADPREPRGVLLEDGFTEGPGDDSGSLGGERLYLLDDGRFASIARSGVWHDDPEKPDQWVTKARVVESVIGDVEAAAVLAPSQLAERLAELIEQQLKGSGNRRAEQLERRAERLRAVAVLLRE